MHAGVCCPEERARKIATEGVEAFAYHLPGVVNVVRNALGEIQTAAERTQVPHARVRCPDERVLFTTCDTAVADDLPRVVDAAGDTGGPTESAEVLHAVSGRPEKRVSGGIPRRGAGTDDLPSLVDGVADAGSSAECSQVLFAFTR